MYNHVSLYSENINCYICDTIYYEIEKLLSNKSIFRLYITHTVKYHLICWNCQHLLHAKNFASIINANVNYNSTNFHKKNYKHKIQKFKYELNSLRKLFYAIVIYFILLFLISQGNYKDIR